MFEELAKTGFPLGEFVRANKQKANEIDMQSSKMNLTF